MLSSQEVQDYKKKSFGYNLGEMLNHEELIGVLSYEKDSMDQYFDKEKLIQLVDYICQIQRGESYERDFRYPTMATQVLMIDSDYIVEAFLENDLIDYMLVSLPQLNHTQMGFLFQVLTHFYDLKAAKVLAFFYLKGFIQKLMEYLDNTSLALFFVKLMVHNNQEDDYLEMRIEIIDKMFNQIEIIHKEQRNDDKSNTLIQNIQLILSELLIFHLDFNNSQQIQKNILTNHSYQKIIFDIINDKECYNQLLESIVIIQNSIFQNVIQRSENNNDNNNEDINSAIKVNVVQKCQELQTPLFNQLQNIIDNQNENKFCIKNLNYIILFNHINNFQIVVQKQPLQVKFYSFLILLIFKFKTNSILQNKIYQILQSTFQKEEIVQQTFTQEFLQETQLIKQVLLKQMKSNNELIRQNNTGIILNILNLLAIKFQNVLEEQQDYPIIKENLMDILNKEQYIEPKEIKSNINLENDYSNEFVNTEKFSKYTAKQNYNDFFDDFEDINVDQKYQSNDSLSSEYASNHSHN